MPQHDVIRGPQGVEAPTAPPIGPRPDPSDIGALPLVDPWPRPEVNLEKPGPTTGRVLAESSAQESGFKGGSGLSSVELAARELQRRLQGLPRSFIDQGAEAIANVHATREFEAAAVAEVERLISPITRELKEQKALKTLSAYGGISPISPTFGQQLFYGGVSEEARNLREGLFEQLQPSESELEEIEAAKAIALEATELALVASFKLKFWNIFPGDWRNGDANNFEEAILRLAGSGDWQNLALGDANNFVGLISQTDLQEMKAWWDLITPTISQIPTEDDLDALVDAYIQKPRAKFTNLDNMTTAEIHLALSTPARQGIPAGMTRADVRAALAELLTSPEILEQESSSRAFFKEIAEEFQLELLRTNALKAKLIDPTLPKLTGWQQLQLGGSQPTLLIAEGLETWFEHTTMPWVAMLTRTGALPIVTGGVVGLAALGMTKNPSYAVLAGLAAAQGGKFASTKYRGELSLLYDQARASGDGWWMANTTAYEEWDSPLVFKILLETLADPTSLWGTGIVGHAFPLSAKGVTGGFSAALKARPFGASAPRFVNKSVSSAYALGTTFGAFEHGFIRFTDDAFRAVLPTQAGIFPMLAGGAAGGLTLLATRSILPAIGVGLAAAVGTSIIYRRLPKTIAQVGNTKAAALMQRLRAVSFYRFQIATNDTAMGNYKRRVPSQFIKDTADEAVEAYLKNPDQALLDDFTRLGKELFDGANVYEGWSSIEDLSRLLGKNLKVGDSNLVAAFEGTAVRGDKQFLSEFNKLLFRLPGRKGFLGAREHARLISRMFGKVDDDSVQIVLDWVKDRRNRIAAQATAPLSSSSSRQALRGMTRQVVTTTELNARGPIATLGFQDGMAVGAQKFVEASAKYTMAGWIEKHMVYPFSRAVLLFLNYGLFNVLENGWRTASAGINPFPARGMDHTVLMAAVWDDTPAYPISYSLRAMGENVTTPGPLMAVPRDASESIFGLPSPVEGRLPGITRSWGATVGLLPGSVGRVTERGVNKVIPKYLQSLSNWNELWSEFGSQQSAWYLGHRAIVALEYNAPEAMTQIRAATGLIPGDLRQHMRGKWISALQYEADNVQLLGPMEFRNLKNTVPIFKAKQLASLMEETLEQYIDLEPVIKDTLISKVIAGEIRAENVHTKMVGLRAAHLELSAVERATWEGVLMKDAFNQFGNLNATNTEQLLSQIQNLEFMVESIGGETGTLATMIRTATERGHEMQAAGRHALHTKTRQNMEDLTVTMNKGLRDQVQAFQEQVRGAPTNAFSMDNIELDLRGSLPRFQAGAQFETKTLTIRRHEAPLEGLVGTGTFTDEVFTLRQAADQMIQNLPHGVQTRIKKVQFTDRNNWEPEKGVLEIKVSDALDETSFLDLRRRAQGVELLDDIHRGDATNLYDLLELEEFRLAYMDELAAARPEGAPSFDIPAVPGIIGPLPPGQGLVSSSFLFPEGFDSVLIERTLRTLRIKDLGRLADEQAGFISAVAWDRGPLQSGKILDGFYPTNLDRLTLDPQVADLLDQYLILSLEGHSKIASPRGVQNQGHNIVFGKDGDSSRYQEFFGPGGKIEIAYEAYWRQQAVNKSQLREIDRQISVLSGLPPRPVDIRQPAFGRITSSDVAFLYGGSVDDMSKNLIDTTTMTLKSREAYVRDNLLEATANANRVGKKPEDFGFSEESLAIVYDDLMRTLSFDPNNITHNTPMNEMWKGIEMDTTWALQGAGLDPAANDILNEWYEQGARNLEQLPYFKKTIKTPVRHFTAQSFPVESKVRDASGQPVVVGHGANVGYEFSSVEYRVSPDSIRAPGFWFAEDLTVPGGSYSEGQMWNLPRLDKTFDMGVWVPDDPIFGGFTTPGEGKYVPTGQDPISGEFFITPQESRTPETETGFNAIEDFVKGLDSEVEEHATVTYARMGNRIQASVGYPDATDFAPQVNLAYLDIRNPFNVVEPTDEMWAAYIPEWFKVTSKDPQATIQNLRNKGFDDIADALDAATTGLATDANDQGVIDAILRVHKDVFFSLSGGQDPLVKNASEIFGAFTDAAFRTSTTDAGRHAQGFARQTILKDAGFDGIHHYGRQDGKVWVAFDPDQILNPGSEPLNAFHQTPDESDWWKAQRDQAMEEATIAQKQDFPDYTGQNGFDAGMRWVYPFWVYEQSRFPWIVKHMVQQPGITAAWGRYQNNTDGGYFSIPGTDIQVNPLRGTVYQGGVRRLYKQDYQEFADQLGPTPGILDYGSRYGYYPGIQFALPIAEFGGLSSQRGELLPPAAQTILGAITAMAPNAGWVKTLNEIIFPDRFRDFNIQRVAIGNGADGAHILAKINNGLSLTEEEESAWAKARRKVALVSASLDAQVGLFRLRPEEQIAAYKAYAEGREFLTGISVEQQEEMRKYFPITGERFSDTYPMDPLSQYALREGLEKEQDWLRPNIAPLLPSRLGDLQFKIQLFYSDQEKIWEDARNLGFYSTNSQGEVTLSHESLKTLEDRWTSGLINSDDYLSAVNNTLQRAVAAVEQLKQTEVYRDVPKTRQEREDYWEEFGIPQPTFSAGQELLWEYYNIKPETSLDELGVPRLDWDTYFLRIELILDAMGELARPLLLTRLQVEWTDSQILHWTINKSFLRPYKNVADAVSDTFSTEEQAIIKRYRRADPPERERLRAEEIGGDQNIPGAPTQGVISTYERQTQQFRENLRVNDPELDAWLLFWGEVDTLKTDEAKPIYNDLISKHRPGAEMLEL